MGVGARDGDGFSPVSKLQQALFELGYDLGDSNGTGVDGIYGTRTAEAVRLFKETEELGFEQFGDVGPGTMHRLNELFPGDMPVCTLAVLDPEPGPSLGSLASPSGAGLMGTSSADLAKGAPLLAFGIPGLMCQIKPVKPPRPAPHPRPAPASAAPRKLSDLPAAIRARIRVDTNITEQSEVDAAYRPFKDGVKNVATVDGIVFGDGVPGDKDTHDGLTRVAQMLLESKTKRPDGTTRVGFPFNTTRGVLINSAPSTRKDGTGPPLEGGLFRFTNINMGTAKDPKRLMLVEKLEPTVDALLAAEWLFLLLFGLPFLPLLNPKTMFDKKYAPVGWTIEQQFNLGEVMSIDAALEQVRQSAKLKARGITWLRSPPHERVLKTEDGHYDPNDNTITIADTAFTPSAERSGIYARGPLTVGHELGHALSNLDQGAKAGFDRAAKGSDPITDYGATSSEENFAECFALFSALPSELEALRPSIFAFFAGRYR